MFEGTCEAVVPAVPDIQRRACGWSDRAHRPPGPSRAALRLLDSVTCPNGMLLLSYGHAGEPTSGTLAIERDSG